MSKLNPTANGRAQRGVIGIAGAGIGGLTVAHALRQRGLEVEILERAPALRAAGSGITIQSNAMLVYDALGLGAEVRAAGRVLARAEVRSLERGLLAAMELRDQAERVGAPGVAILRERLARVLAQGLDEVLCFDATVERIEQHEAGGGVTVGLAGGATRHYAALIGCDGLHSAVRRALFGEEVLRYSGYTTWRGVAPVGTLAESALDVTIETFGGPRRFGQVPVAADAVYWFAVELTEAGGRDGAEPRGELLERFAGWPESVTSLIAATPPEALIRTDVHDRVPRATWGQGSVTLLGDAAHPMTPNLGQGGGQAIEDALALAIEVGRASSLAAGFRAYEARRVPRANEVVVRSWRMGRVAHLQNPVGRWLRDSTLRMTPSSLAVRGISSLYAPARALVEDWRVRAPSPAGA